MSRHRELREALGAYALGRLPAAGRADVEAHLPGCSTCREELASLAALPGLLGRLDAAEAVALVDAIDSTDAAAVIAGVAWQRRAELRRLRRWQAMAATAAAAAVAVAVVAVLPDRSDADPPSAPVVAIAATAGGTTGTATAHPWDWGTTVELELQGLPAAERFEVVAVTEDGTREVVGSWTGTADGEVYWRGGTAVATIDLARIEITDAEGLALLAAEPPQGG